MRPDAAPISAAAGPCHNGSATFSLASTSLCPKQRWLDRLAPLLLRLCREHGPLTIVNAGANKGYNLVSAWQRFAGAGFTNADWHHALLSYLRQVRRPSTSMLCGVCGACKEPRAAEAGPAIAVSVHAFEPDSSTYDWLRWGFDHFSVRRFGNVSLSHAALSNVTGEYFMRPGITTGKETSRPLEAKAPGFEPLRVFALDDYLARRAVRRVHFASFDAESFDVLILQGLSWHLERGRVDAFEFEWQSGFAGMVHGWSLQMTLARLEDLSYACFWQGADGCLAPAANRCHTTLAATGKFSGAKFIGNIVCGRNTARGRSSPEPSPGQRLWDLSNECG